MEISMNEKMILLANRIVSTMNTEAHYKTKGNTGDYKNIKMSVKTTPTTLYFSITADNAVSSFTIPVPFLENGCWLIKTNQSKRPIGDFLNIETKVVLTYDQIVAKLLLEPLDSLILEGVFDGKVKPLIKRLVDDAVNNTIPLGVKKITTVISKLTQLFPIHTTIFNSYIMNKRVYCIDQRWQEVCHDPKEVLAYQIKKNRDFFDKGYTSLGLADQSLTDNYLLSMDLRLLAPYGMPYFKAQRNLYSTLGMKGTETPTILTETEVSLKEIGVERHGFNLWTLFCDVPNVYEDQILVHKELTDKIIIKKSHNYICYGETDLIENDGIKCGDLLSYTETGTTKFDEPCEKAVVKSVRPYTNIVGGVETKAIYITIETTHRLCDGFKLTNRHGNKGIVRIADLGYGIDPVTGEKRRIDLIVSAKTNNKRGNVSQIVEILHNLVNTHTNSSLGGVVKTTPTETIETLQNKLVAKGFNSDCATKCVLNDVGMLLDTTTTIVNGHCQLIEPTKTVKGIFGPMFWGCIKLPEVNVWDESDIRRKDSTGLQQKGQKMGIVEFRALQFRLGMKRSAPVLQELLSHTTSTDKVREVTKMIQSCIGSHTYKEQQEVATMRVCESMSTVSAGAVGRLLQKQNTLMVNKIKPLIAQNRTMFYEHELTKTICDENFLPLGGYLKLPVKFQTAQAAPGTIEGDYMGPVRFTNDEPGYTRICVTEHIYIPSYELRKPWLHENGMYGMNDVAANINNIIAISQKENASSTDIEGTYIVKQLFGAIRKYYTLSINLLCGKNGAISETALSVRSPFSCKATATLSTTIPFGCVEIHTSLAKMIGIEHEEIAIIERYPLLGFMGIVPVKVLVTNDEQCRWTIRVGHNSLASAGLDFDGDTIYITALKTPEAQAVIEDEWRFPNKECWDALIDLNFKKGTPMLKEMTLDDYNCTPQPVLDVELQSTYVEKNTGVKVQTGIVIASMYNVMRMLEVFKPNMNRTTEVNVEKFIEKAGQSVFSQKHGAKSLCDIVIEALNTADKKELIEAGFEKDAVDVLCDTVVYAAKSLKIDNLVKYHQTQGKTFPLLNNVVKTYNKFYSLARTSSPPGSLTVLNMFSKTKADYPGRVFSRIMSRDLNTSNYMMQKQDDALLSQVCDGHKEVCTSFFSYIDSKMMYKSTKGFEPKVITIKK